MCGEHPAALPAAAPCFWSLCRVVDPSSVWPHALTRLPLPIWVHCSMEFLPPCVTKSLIGLKSPGQVLKVSLQAPATPGEGARQAACGTCTCRDCCGSSRALLARMSCCSSLGAACLPLSPHWHPDHPAPGSPLHRHCAPPHPAPPRCAAQGERAETCPTQLWQMHICLPAKKGHTRLLYRMATDFMGWTNYVPFIEHFWRYIAGQVLVPGARGRVGGCPKHTARSKVFTHFNAKQ